MPNRIALLTVLALGLTPVQSESGPDVSLTPSVTLIGADADRAAHADDVLARYQQARLALPDLKIRFHDDAAACRGHDGLFQESETPWRILICSRATYVLAHELAHAWEAANLTDADRHRFADRYGFSTWDGRDVPWNERAEEHAAFVIQQILMDTSGDRTTPRWIERTEAYELLTGQP